MRTKPVTRAQLALAGVFRALPEFRGKWRLARRLRSRLAASLSAGEAVRQVRMRDGSRMTLDVRSETEGAAFYLGHYEAILPAVLRLVTERSAVIDVGAHVGLYAVPLGRHVRALGGKCVAFEPVPANHARLVENVQANDLAQVVRALAVALGEERRTITMLLDESGGATTGNAVRMKRAELDEATGTFSAFTWQRGHRPVTVEMRRLDDCVADLELGDLPCRFVKVDIEGNEPHFFRGAARFLAAHRPLVLAELNPEWLARNELEVADYFDVLGPLGYAPHLRRRGAWVEVAAVAGSFSQKGIQTVLLVPPEFPASRLRV